MKKKDVKHITCPNCHSELDIDAILFEQFSDSIKKDLHAELREREQEIRQLAEERLAEAKEQLEMESFVKVKEKENIIESLRTKLQDATQRLEQGSMQMQGERFELAVEDLLRNAHAESGDLIEEIKKGQKGFDIHHSVRISAGTIGSIGYEIKNTKTWSDSFIEKIKSDNLEAKCDLLVVVTKALPKEMEGQRFILKDGVWITTINYVTDLSILLRFGLLKVYAQKQIQKNGEQKAHILYSFLTSESCQSIFNSMMDGLKNLQEMNDEEERKLQALFKKRQKQLQQILSNVISYYGTMKGIADDSIQDIPSLEFKKAS